MILYSIVPVDIVFKNFDDGNEIKYFETEYMGEKIQVVEAGNNQYRIARIISTSPGAFLNPGLQPGCIISNIKVN